MENLQNSFTGSTNIVSCTFQAAGGVVMTIKLQACNTAHEPTVAPRVHAVRLPLMRD